MASLLLRNLPDETHRALKVRAARNGRATEAEVRAILEDSVRPKARLKLGSALRNIGGSGGGIDLIVTRDQTPMRTVSFE